MNVWSRRMSTKLAGMPSVRSATYPASSLLAWDGAESKTAQNSASQPFGLPNATMHSCARSIPSRSCSIAARIEQLREGIDRAHECMVAFGNPKGWLALFWAVLLSAPSHANKLLAGYVALRALGIPANFVDILLLQTFITFLLYFAPTPGSAGLAEFLSAAVMQIYVGPSQLPLYALIWRFINSYATVIAGSLLFWYWLRSGLVGREEAVNIA